jgi:hypothetical protein
MWITLRRPYITASAGNTTLRYTVAVIFFNELYHNDKMEHQYASFEHSYIFFQITEQLLFKKYLYLWSMKYMAFLLSLY